MMHLLSYPRWVGGSAGLGRVPIGHFGWTERKASGIRRPSFCARSCYLCDLGQVPGRLCASFPHSANGTSLPHPSQHQELREEQAQGEGCGGMGVEEWGRPTPGSVCGVGGTPSLHPRKRQH